MRASLVILALLAACGGGTVAVITAPPAGPAASAPAASAPDVQAPAASAPEPAASTPAASPSWATLLWREPWERLSVGGWVRREQHPRCPESGTDPGSPPEASFGVQPDGWVTVGAVDARVSAGHLLIDQVQTGGGWALLHGTLLDHTRPLRVETTIDLQPDPGAWLGITLHAGEGDYREISIYESGGALTVGAWTPCFVRRDLAPVALGTRAVALEYTPPPAEVCWRYYVDDVLVLTERCDDRGAALDGAPRVGVFAVNALAEHERGYSGHLRAIVGPISVWSR